MVGDIYPLLSPFSNRRELTRGARYHRGVNRLPHTTYIPRGFPLLRSVTATSRTIPGGSFLIFPSSGGWIWITVGISGMKFVLDPLPRHPRNEQGPCWLLARRVEWHHRCRWSSWVTWGLRFLWNKVKDMGVSGLKSSPRTDGPKRMEAAAVFPVPWTRASR